MVPVNSLVNVEYKPGPNLVTRFNDFPAAAPERVDPGPQGGCVIHKLNYDSAGKYVGAALVANAASTQDQSPERYFSLPGSLNRR